MNFYNKLTYREYAIVFHSLSETSDFILFYILNFK